MCKSVNARKEKRKRVSNLEDGCGWGVAIPLPTFSIKAEGPKVGLQLELVPTAQEVIRVAQLDKLLLVHGGTDGRIRWLPVGQARARNENEERKEEKKRGGLTCPSCTPPSRCLAVGARGPWRPHLPPLPLFRMFHSHRGQRRQRQCQHQ